MIGATAYDEDGEKIGKVGQLFLDDQTGRPEFVTVNTGFFGTSESFVPVAEATFNGDRLVLPFSKDKVKGAPNVDLDGRHLDESEEQRLYEYYGMSGSELSGNADTADTSRTAPMTDAQTTDAGYAESTRDTDTTRTTDVSDSTRDTDRDSTAGTAAGAGTGEHDTSGQTSDDAMTRSEEQVRVDTTSQQAGRARLRKYVTTEQETHTVPVRKEKAVLETEPITDDNVGAATSGPDISEDEHEVVLNEERAVVDKTVEPVERVRLGTETTTDEETVTEEVRKEQVEVEGDADRR
ncbi:MAG TPA: PRC and DUF2382 domain-containing protein [Nocardioides sp.]|nr:PRC and DUF2382 domain-containing protein [Nocardioides sp.]